MGHKSEHWRDPGELVRTAVSGDFLADLAVKTQPANAGDAGSIPDWGARIPHALGQLSPGAATREACVLQQTQHSQKRRRNAPPLFYMELRSASEHKL